MNEIKHPCFNTDEPCEFEVMYNQTIAERDRLRQVNAELAYALKGIIEGDSPNWIDIARAALTAAKGE